MSELTELVRAFETQNSVELTISGQLVDSVHGLDLRWTAFAWDGDPDRPEAKYLASASVRCGEKRLLTMETVLLNLLYTLDSQLALREFQAVIRG